MESRTASAPTRVYPQSPLITTDVVAVRAWQVHDQQLRVEPGGMDQIQKLVDQKAATADHSLVHIICCAGAEEQSA